MSESFSAIQISQFIDRKLLFPFMPMFNRLEGRPRTHDFERALRAEIRDPLWLLTKQWQMGEFRGDDAGSPTTAKIYLDKTRLTKYQPLDNPTESFDDSLPLEAKVEKRKIPFKAAEVEISLDLRLLMGRHWQKLLRKHSLDGAFIELYRQNFAIHDPDPNIREDVHYCASPQSWRKYAATATRHIDGKKLYDDIVSDPAAHATTVGAAGLDHDKLVTLGERFVAWFDKLFYQPEGPSGNDAWQPEKLEYGFSCAAPKGETEQVYRAEEYYHGHLDWYNFSIDAETEALEDPEGAEQPPEGFDDPIIRGFIPTPVQFDGMPNTRWWAFEEGKTNFGDIKPDTTDLNKLLLIEFGLVYANDWYLLPLTVPAGTIGKIRGMSVQNVFGENFWITATGRGLDDNPDRWTMYSMDIQGSERKPADLSLMVVPSVPKIQEGKPIEEVQLARDEVANMVWGVENRIPLPSGISIPGSEAASDTLAYLKRIIEQSAAPPAAETPSAATLRYRIMNSIPENWIPFISTHVPGNNRQTRLQRGSMPRIIEGDPMAAVEKIKPRSNLLREGLNQSPKQSYFINEEEVPRAGINVKQSFQRTRWYSGEVVNWIGVRKRTGRGEAASMLQFDSLQKVQMEKGKA